MRYSPRERPRRRSRPGRRRISIISPTLACCARSSATLAEVLVVGADPALRGLLAEWLQPLGHRVVEQSGAADLVLVDIPNPRREGVEALRRIARQHPRAPRLVLSSSFFPGVD